MAGIRLRNGQSMQNKKTRSYHARRCAVALVLGAGAQNAISQIDRVSGAPTRSPSAIDQLRQEFEREQGDEAIRRQLDRQLERRTDAEPIDDRINDPGEDAFFINRIEINGDKDSSTVVRTAIVRRYENTMMGPQQVAALIRELTNYYVKLGYSTTSVLLLPANLRDGTLRLEVRWGIVAGWLINGRPVAGIRDQWLIAQLPAVAGMRLNIRDIDHAVETLNTGMRRARISVVAAPTAGQSYLDIVVEENNLYRLSLGVDNSGVNKTKSGRYRATAALAVAGFAGETWSVNLAGRHYDDATSDLEESAGIALTIPYGYWLGELSYGHFRYERELRGTYGGYISDGWSRDTSVKIARLLSRSSESTTSAYARLNVKSNNNFIEQLRLDINSKTYTDLTLGLTRLESLWGGALYSEVAWTQGTTLFGADAMERDKAGKIPALYDKVSGNLSWTRRLPSSSYPFNLNLRMGWQYSPRPLLASNQFSIGDDYTVRGFKKRGVYGDNGAFLSSTLQLNLPVVSPFIGVDAGAVRNQGLDSSVDSIAGWALGIRGQYGPWQVSLLTAKPIRTAQGLNKEPVVSFTARLTI